MAIERTPRIDLSTAGIAVGYAVGTAGTTPPTKEYTHVPGISGIPGMNEQPEMIDTTTFDELYERVGVPGLKGLPSATGFTANFTQALDEQWADVMEKFKALGENEAMWWCIAIPGITKAFFFMGEPSPLSIDAAQVASANTTTLYITKKGEMQRAAQPEMVAWTKTSA